MPQGLKIFSSTNREKRTPESFSTSAARSETTSFNKSNSKIKKMADEWLPEDKIVTDYDILAVDNNIMYISGKDSASEFWVISMDLATKKVVVYQKGLGINLNP